MKRDKTLTHLMTPIPCLSLSLNTNVRKGGRECKKTSRVTKNVVSGLVKCVSKWSGGSVDR